MMASGCAWEAAARMGIGPHAGFRLRKWYLDVTGPAGEAAIAYHARAQVAGLAATYESLLFATPEGFLQRSRLGRSLAPERRGDEIRWSSDSLDVRLLARALSAPVAEALLDGPQGSLVWRCRQPLARVEVSGAAAIVGLGYVEELELTVPPWRLPIDTLRWGRFGADGGAGSGAGVGLVWIEWRGRDPRRLCFRVSDGRCERVEAREIGEAEVVLSSGRLELSDPLVLRREALGGLLPDGPLAERLRRALPKGLLQARETKWRSRAVFREGGRAASGWAIHETVDLR